MKKKILICNDDGIESGGIIALAERFAEKNEVRVFAPDGNRSACSHSLTLGQTVSLFPYDKIKGCKAYCTTGFPADCVKMARHIFSDFVPDLVLSGINKGHHFGSDVLYSGTVSIAYEAAFFGHPAFAFSAFSHGESDFKLYAAYAEKIVDKLLPLSDGRCVWNVNFPDCGVKIRGVKFAALGNCVYKDFYDKRGENEYVLRSETEVDGANGEDTDVTLIRKGFITVTPLLYDRTDYGKMAELNDKLLKDEDGICAE